MKISIELTDEQMAAYRVLYRSADNVDATLKEVTAIIAKDVQGRADSAVSSALDSQWEKLPFEDKKNKLSS